MTVVTRKVSAAHATPAMPRGAARAVLNGVMTMLKTLAAVAAGIVLVTIAFAKFARGIPTSAIGRTSPTTLDRHRASHRTFLAKSVRHCRQTLPVVAFPKGVQGSVRTSVNRNQEDNNAQKMCGVERRKRADGR